MSPKERKYKFSFEQESALIDFWRENESLWNPKCPDYLNKGFKNAKLTELSSKLNIPEFAIRLKWHNLRSQYCRELRKLKKSSDTTWIHYKRMLFLKNGTNKFFDNQDNLLATENDKDDSLTDKEEEGKNEAEEEIADDRSVILDPVFKTQQWINSLPSSSHNNVDSQSTSELNESKLKQKNNCNKQILKNELLLKATELLQRQTTSDEVGDFCRSLSHRLRALTPDQWEEAQYRIWKLVYEIHRGLISPDPMN